SRRSSRGVSAGRTKRQDPSQVSDRLRSTRRLLRVEGLEDRCLLAPFTVTTTADNGNNLAPTAGSLRQAILGANATPGTDTINFNILGIGPFTISPPTALPTITDPVIIDGYTQLGATANTLAVGDNAVLK